MYNKAQRPSEVIAMQKRIIEEQESIIEILKGALAAAGAEPVETFKPWMQGLTTQERALLGALYQAYPRPLGRYELLELMPGLDHVEERQAQVVTVKVHHLRKKLGLDAIENERGMGYRLSARQHAAMRDAPRPQAPRLSLVENDMQLAA